MHNKRYAFQQDFAYVIYAIAWDLKLAAKEQSRALLGKYKKSLTCTESLTGGLKQTPEENLRIAFYATIQLLCLLVATYLSAEASDDARSPSICQSQPHPC